MEHCICSHDKDWHQDATGRCLNPFCQNGQHCRSYRLVPSVATIRAEAEAFLLRASGQAPSLDQINRGTKLALASYCPYHCPDHQLEIRPGREIGR
jgi:hypothetical protein